MTTIYTKNTDICQNQIKEDLRLNGTIKDTRIHQYGELANYPVQVFNPDIYG